MYLTHANFNKTVKTINRLNKRLQKKGMNLISYTNEDKVLRMDELFPNVKFNTLEAAQLVEVVDFNFTSNFDSIHLETGWEFIGVIDHVENMVHTFVDDVDVEGFRNRQICDHCKTKRIRNKTVILRKDNELIQVGTKCLSDFFNKDMSELVKVLDLYALNHSEENCKDDFYFGGVPSDRLSVELNTVLEQTVANIRINGFRPSSCGDESTRFFLCEALFHYNHKAYINPSDEDKKVAKEVVEYMSSLPMNNEYNRNILQIVKNGRVTYHTIGYIPAVVNSYLHSLVEKVTKKESTYYGNVGDKVEMEVVLTNAHYFHSTYGYRTVWTSIYTFANEEGQIFMWKTTTDYDLERGKTYKVKATIKEHSEYTGVKQTVLTRAKIA